MSQPHAGVTLIELLVALAVMVVLAATAAPLVGNMREKQRVAAATEAVLAQVMLAKSESGKRSEEIRVEIKDGANWSVGVSDVGSCDPAGTDCTLSYVESNGAAVTKLQVINSSEYTGVSIASSSPDDIEFNPIRGTADSGTVVLQSDNYETRILVSSFARVRVCSPTSAKLGRYPDC